MWESFFATNEEGRITVLISGVIVVVVGYIFYLLISRLRGEEVKNIGDQGYEIDGITEKANAVPAIMHFIMIGAVLFGFWYWIVGYPIFSWNQAQQYNDRVAALDLRVLQNQKAMADNQVVTVGQQLFEVKCAACHGSDGAGLNGFAANLQEFGTEQHIYYVIKNGSKGLGHVTPSMPAQYDILDPDPTVREQKARDVAAYTLTLSGKTPREGNPEAGKAVFSARCVTCHGPNGNGGGPTGAIPNFSANLTEYGTVAYIERILRHGKNGHIGQMPDFLNEGTLSDFQLNAISQYVESALSGKAL